MTSTTDDPGTYLTPAATGIEVRIDRNGVDELFHVIPWGDVSALINALQQLLDSRP